MRPLLLLLLLVLLATPACDEESFAPGPAPDLYKTPYDFGLGGGDAGMRDGGSDDMHVTPEMDLSSTDA